MNGATGRGSVAPLASAFYSALLLAALAALPAACTTAPAHAPVAAAQSGSAGAEWSSRYAALAADGGTLYRLDPQRSSVRIFVFRGGRAPKLGHNHVLAAPDFTGYCYLPAAGPSGAQFDLEFALDRLALDDPRTRAQLGPAFAAELTPADIASTRAHMLGEDNLQAGRFPYLRIHALAVTGEGDHYAASIAVELHGQRQTMTVPLLVTSLPAQIRASGALVLRQSDFGVHPYSALGGLVAVQDDVLVEFTVVGD